MGWWHHGVGPGMMGGWGGLVVGVLMMLLVWGGLFALIYFAVRAGNRAGVQDRGRQPTDRALEILAERFAHGEIEADEYREMKRELTS